MRRVSLIRDSRLMVALLVLMAFAAVQVFAIQAGATLYRFDSILNNSAANAATGENQLFMDVTDGGGGQVIFTFSNIGPNPSSITNVYFDDDETNRILPNTFTIVEGPGVLFSQPASPSYLPGWKYVTPPFVVTWGLSADADLPLGANGVDPGEWVEFHFNLPVGKSFDDLITELTMSDLRVGIGMRGFTRDLSCDIGETFINDPAPVPIPPTALLLGSGLLGLLGFRMEERQEGVIPPGV